VIFVAFVVKESDKRMNSSVIKAEKEIGETYWWFVGRRAILDAVLRCFAKRCRKAVDVGCGSGSNLKVLSRHADWVAGFDRSGAALELAATHGLPAARADAQSTPLATCSVDLVSALDVLEHLDDDLLALAEFHRVLRPDGYLLISVPAYRFLWSEHDEALMHRRRYVASELHAKLNRSGFRVLKRSYAVFFTFFPIVLYRLFRGLIPKDPMAPKASHVVLPGFVNHWLIALLRLEAWLLGTINLPVGTSIVVLAQRLRMPETRAIPFISPVCGIENSAEETAKVRFM
jgi:SAM-dependent methyltransferase